MDFRYPYTDFHELNLDWFMARFKELVEEWDSVKEDWNSLHDYVQNYFDNLNVQTEINNKINAMIADGSFALILTPLVEAALPTIVDGKLPAVVASQIGAVVASQIGAVVAGQLPAVAAQAAADEVGAWLEGHVNPDTGYVIDKSLTIGDAAADAEVVGNELDIIKNGLDEISEKSEIILHKSDFATSYDATYVNNGYIGTYGGFTANAGYRTFYLQVAQDMEVYLTRIVITDDTSIALFNSSGPATANFIARYRFADSNMPTDDNRLHITAGQWVAISLYSSNALADFNLFTGHYVWTDMPTDDFASNMATKLNLAKFTATKSATSLSIYMGPLKYEVNKYNNSTIRAVDLWRTNACWVWDGSAYQTIWEDSDSDGVVKISGEGDFIGGYHGDETQTMFKLFIDGIEYSDDAIFSDKEFNELIIYAESDVYHCNTSATPDVVAFKRNKILKFNKDGYTTENYWVAQQDLTCEISYFGMLSVEDTIINGYHSNADYKLRSSGNITNNAAITDVLFNTDYGDIGIKLSEPVPSAHYGTNVSVYTGRKKVYASQFISSAHGSLQNGDILHGKAVTYFN